MTNGDKLIASILKLEKIKREERQEQEKQIFINNLIIKALEKQIIQLEKDNKNIMKGWQ